VGGDNVKEEVMEAVEVERASHHLPRYCRLCRSRFPKTLWIWKVPQAGFIMLLK